MGLSRCLYIKDLFGYAPPTLVCSRLIDFPFNKKINSSGIVISLCYRKDLIFHFIILEYNEFRIGFCCFIFLSDCIVADSFRQTSFIVG